MKQLLIPLLLTLAVTTFGQTQPAPPAPASLDAEEAITRLREGLIDSFNKGDVEHLLTYLDTNVVVTWQNGEVCRGPAAVRAYYDKMMQGEHRIVREAKSNPEVLGRQVYGDWALSWGNLHDTIVLMDGTELPFNTLFTATTVKRGDRWQVLGFHASVNVFKNPVLSLAVHKTAYWAGGIGAAVGLFAGIILTMLFRRRRNTDAKP
jgi:ketosteroid isomerase-like protein